MVIREQRAPRGGWLHVIREAHPDYPSRGVPGIQRAKVTYEMATVLEDALLREGHQPSKSIIPVAQGLSDPLKKQYRAFAEDRSMQVIFPETQQAGFGGGRTGAPQTDWKPHRLHAGTVERPTCRPPAKLRPGWLWPSVLTRRSSAARRQPAPSTGRPAGSCSSSS